MWIKSKLQQIESLNELATSCTIIYSDMPRKPNRGGSKIERAILKLIEVEESLKQDVEELVEFKRWISVFRWWEIHNLYQWQDSGDKAKIYNSARDKAYLFRASWSFVRTRIKLYFAAILETKAGSGSKHICKKYIDPCKFGEALVAGQ